MKWLRLMWIYLNVAAATMIFGGLIILTAPFDRSKRFIGWHSRLWARWILWSTGLPITIRGKELLQKGQQYIYMSNHASALDRALKALQAKAISLILYPEGTRTDDGRLLPFKRGVFHIALRSRLPLVPVAVRGSFEAMPPGAMSLTPTPIQVTIGQPIETKALTDKDCTALLKDAHDRIQSLLDINPT